MKVYQKSYFIKKTDGWEKSNFLEEVNKTIFEIQANGLQAEVHYSGFSCKELLYDSALILAYTEE